MISGRRAKARWPCLRFRTVIANGFHELDRAWLREVRKNAKFVWIRFAGLSGVKPATAGSRLVSGWERVATAMADSRRCAYLYVQFGRTIAGEIPQVGQFQSFGLGTGHSSAREVGKSILLWPQTMGAVADRVASIIHQVRIEQPWDLGVFAEDFSARWVLKSAVRPDRIVLDNPILSAGEAAASDLLRRHFFVRSSHWADLRWFDSWQLHFPAEQLLAGQPSSRRHGWWSPKDRERIVEFRHAEDSKQAEGDPEHRAGGV